MRKFIPLVIALMFVGGMFQNAFADTASKEMAVHPAERNMQTAQARAWKQVSPDNIVLEGAIFDSSGNLLFCDVSGKSVMRMTPDRQLDTLVKLPRYGAGGLALHKDGRVFMATLDLDQGKGEVVAWTPDTNKLETIIPADAGYWPNDLVFDGSGGFYFSDFRGNATNPIGGIYYVSSDFKTVTPVIKGLGQANGVALSPDGKTLWATEFAKNRLHRAQLDTAVAISPIGSSIPYYFTGAAPDSMRVDKEGNVYVAMYGQGRVLVFDKKGIPLSQILLPDSAKGKNLQSTSLAIKPHDKTMFIVSSDESGQYGANIFMAPALSEGLDPMPGRNMGKAKTSGNHSGIMQSVGIRGGQGKLAGTLDLPKMKGEDK